MPLFEYRCQSCQATFELLVRSNEKPVCPECNSKKLQKLLSAPSAHVSGSTGSLPVVPPCGMPDAPCRSGCCHM